MSKIGRYMLIYVHLQLNEHLRSWDPVCLVNHETLPYPYYDSISNIPCVDFKIFTSKFFLKFNENLTIHGKDGGSAVLKIESTPPGKDRFSSNFGRKIGRRRLLISRWTVKVKVLQFFLNYKANWNH